MTKLIRNMLILLIGIIIGVSLSVASYSRYNHPVKEDHSDLILLHEVIETVETYYVDKISREQLVSAAIDGIFKTLDSHSTFLNVDQANDLQSSNRGQYYGFGFEVSPDQTQLVIQTAFPGSPAANAGLQKGDILFTLNQHRVTAANQPQVLDLIKQASQGRQAIALEVKRQNSTFTVTLQPADIRLHSVQAKLLADNIGYLRITHFQQDTAKDVKSWLEHWQQTEINGLIIDVRDNPGGLLEQAVAIADMFLDQGVIVATQGRYINANETFYATTGRLLANVPLVVIINQDSASAAEILTAALRDHQRATVVGEKSFGKGTVQSLIPNLYDRGSMIKLTTARYTTPNGKMLDTKGIEPDIKVTQENGDNSLEVAKDVAKTAGQPNHDHQFDAAISWIETHNHN
ncbi:S41 family peptidase [Shewanella yunxiaonensis]|uniref:S41 family peptidase n=1 Tax=Shewanella yunxiaonensis TaxID=2829809 RepID=A0ABX7YTH1_9GAMM|nr:S41 family peptidase [Shewanella yunxiaonensis]QUN05954.1 S41 family peptidase [Shewanella yunxiaonensis]